jgi:hypothetical protein
LKLNELKLIELKPIELEVYDRHSGAGPNPGKKEY